MLTFAAVALRSANLVVVVFQLGLDRTWKSKWIYDLLSAKLEIMTQTTTVSAEINPIDFYPDILNDFLTGGDRSRPFENVILGAGFGCNLNENSSTDFHWRALVDAMIHF